MTEKWSVWTFSAVLGPLSLLPLGRPRGRFGVGGPTGSCKMRLHMETEHTGETVNSQRMTLNQLFNLWISSALMKRAALGRPHLLLLPRSTPAPALGLFGGLGSARLRRMLFGPSVTHAFVCPTAFKSVGIKAWSWCLEGFRRGKNKS